MDAINPVNLIGLLNQMEKTNNLFYLNPSFGYYFEQFYLEPHGLIYQLRSLPQDTLLPALPDKKLITENEAFWAGAEHPMFEEIEHEIQLADPNQKMSLAQTWLTKLHVTPAVNPNAGLAGVAFSQALNYWGGQLQRSGQLVPAGHHFDNSLRLNPDNVAAEVNRDFNLTLQAGKKPGNSFTEITPDQFGRYRSWNEVLLLNGPFDEPNYALNMAVILISGSYYREALAQLVRVNELVPDNLNARLLLGQVYVIVQKPEQALKTLRQPLENPEKFGLNQTNSLMLNFTAAAAWLQTTNPEAGIKLLKLEISRHPDDSNLRELAAKGCMAHHLYSNALEFINMQLQHTPNDTHWLFGKGFTLVQIKSYPQAAEAFTRVLAVETNNYDALFNRAISYMKAENYEAARTDYLRLQQTFTNAYVLAYGLSDIAMHRQDTNEGIRNCRIYLANAPTNTAEYTLIRQRLATLHAP
jgi:tetratricopeptide (TPR) repeat protein